MRFWMCECVPTLKPALSRKESLCPGEWLFPAMFPANQPRAPGYNQPCFSKFSLKTGCRLWRMQTGCRLCTALRRGCAPSLTKSGVCTAEFSIQYRLQPALSPQRALLPRRSQPSQTPGQPWCIRCCDAPGQPGPDAKTPVGVSEAILRSKTTATPLQRRWNQ